MTISSLLRAPQLKKEDETSVHVPYGVHLTEHTVTGTNGTYMQVIRIGGASFESADDVDLADWHRRLHAMVRKLHNPNVTLWSQLIRRDESKYPAGEYPAGFADRLNRRYAERVAGELLMVNELYITIVYRPQSSSAERMVFKLFKEADPRVIQQERDDALEVMESLSSALLSSLDRRYDAERLGVYELESPAGQEFSGGRYSEVLEFFAYLVNGYWQRVPLSYRQIKNYLTTVRPLFGTEAFEIRSPSETTYGAILGVSQYTDATGPGLLNVLLAMPFSLVLSQSFTYITKPSAQFIVRTQRDRLVNSGDDAQSQIDELDILLDDIASGRVVMGNHHLSLVVKASNVKDLMLNIADATSAMNDCGFMMAREDLAMEAAYWAQLPGNLALRPRLSPITSKNWVGFNSLHNFPSGRRSGNHWGEAVTLLVTEANTPLYFSFHASDPLEDDGGSRKDVGDTLLLGPKGSGKTVVATAMSSMLQKFGGHQIFFTKDRDSEIYIRSAYGTYLPMEVGKPTGCAPFQAGESAEHIQFCYGWVKSLVSRPLKISDEQEIHAAVDWVYSNFEQHQRTLGRLLDHLDVTGEDSVYQHLKKWCYARRKGESDGPYAWAFDNKSDTITDALYGGSKLIGFDTTAFLDNPEIRGPLSRYLFYRVKQLIDGRRITIYIAEFWKFLDDPYCAEFVRDQLKTIRKKNGFLVLDSQSPSDAINHPIARTLIEQTATKILFPNSDADRNEYMGSLSLTEREFLLVKEDMTPGARTFLVKQGKNSVVAKLDLKGFDFELDVLSGRSANIKLVNQLITEHGDDPNIWLPLFEKMRGTA